MKKYSVGKLVSGKGATEHCEIEIDNGVIQSISKSTSASYQFPIAVPGFIDIHTHGYGGISVMDCLDEVTSSKLASKYLMRGTTSFVAGIVTSSLDKTSNLLSWGKRFIAGANKEAAQNGCQSRCIGFHLEGPWLAEEMAGAQNSHLIREYNDKDKSLIDAYNPIIKMVTFDYHNDRNKMMLPLLNEYGIVAAVGHDSAYDYEIEKGFQQGISHVTHIFCVTSSIKKFFDEQGFHKHLGTQEVALYSDGVSVEVIPDNHHITEPIWKLIRHCKQPCDIIAVSDSMPFAGLNIESSIRYENQEIIFMHGAACIKDASLLAGSSISLYDGFCTLVRSWGAAIEEAVQYCSVNPARKLGLSDRIGSLEIGKKADIVFLDEELNLLQVLKNGQEVHVDT